LVIALAWISWQYLVIKSVGRRLLSSN